MLGIARIVEPGYPHHGQNRRSDYRILGPMDPGSMFDHNHHATILEVLKHLNVDLFEESRAYFGGGTLLAMLYNEYRWSQDIDFMCPVHSGGYAHLRKLFII